MKTLSAAFAVSIATLVSGCPLLEVTADAPEVCMTYKDIAVEGMPVDGVQTITQTFTFDDLSVFDEIKDLDSDVRFTSATITAKTGITDFAFLSSAKLDVTSGTDASLPRREFYNCDGNCPRTGAAAGIPVSDQDDAFAYIASGSLVIDLDVTGQLPAQAWSMDAVICVEASSTYSR